MAKTMCELDVQSKVKTGKCTNSCILHLTNLISNSCSSILIDAKCKWCKAITKFGKFLIRVRCILNCATKFNIARLLIVSQQRLSFRILSLLISISCTFALSRKFGEFSGKLELKIHQEHSQSHIRSKF